jgi:hypothetical protein
MTPIFIGYGTMNLAPLAVLPVEDGTSSDYERRPRVESSLAGLLLHRFG